jgi:carnitine-CoA ligase
MIGAGGRLTVADVLRHRAEVNGASSFLVFEEPTGAVLARSYSETYDRAVRTASLLSSMGVGQGDRVHVHLTNRPEFYDCWFACAIAGAVMVPTNPLLATDEIAYVLDHAGCAISVTSPDLIDAVPQESAATLEVGEVFEDRLNAATGVDRREIRPLDPAAILYTSGTTSRPKGVIVTHANYLHAGDVVAGHLRVRPEDRWLVVLPLFHANAQYYSTMSALVSGASIALMPRFSASRWSRQALSHGATLASLFAAPIRMILAQERHSRDRDNRVRAVLFSQNVTQGQLADFEERFDCPLLQLYGMTETIAPPTVNPLYGERRNLSIGVPTLPASLRVVDEENIDVRPGETGELLVHGEPGVTLMYGYLNDSQATSEALYGGWLHTGDQVRVDEDGYFYFVDRAKDLIKRAGENVSAGEVEAVLNGHPAVFEAAVIGVSDPIRDEAVKAIIVRAEGQRVTEEELVDWCRERLAEFKVPSSIEFVDSLPRTSVGKIQKELLRSRERDRQRTVTRE